MAKPRPSHKRLIYPGIEQFPNEGPLLNPRYYAVVICAPPSRDRKGRETPTKSSFLGSSTYRSDKMPFNKNPVSTHPRPTSSSSWQQLQLLQHGLGLWALGVGTPQHKAPKGPADMLWTRRDAMLGFCRIFFR